ncbi:MAG: beta-galactosidase [Eubacteriales bacterium]|nr:beta-galactosidase [Eubacteriales bacterium]
MKPYFMNGILPYTGGLDFSFLLDPPAGKYGFVCNKDGHIAFEDGRRIRFFGCDLCFGAVMPEKVTGEIMAQRMAGAGINIVRFHFADANSEKGSLIDFKKGNTRTLSEESLDRLDYFVFQLKKRGIYIHMDLFVGRGFLPGDELDHSDEMEQSKPLKNCQMFNRRLIELQKEYAELYLTHLNPYTGLRYVDEPAVAVIQMVNENSIFWLALPDAYPSYMLEKDLRWNQWLCEKYGTISRLKDAWTNKNGECALNDDENPLLGTVKHFRIGSWSEVPQKWDDPYSSTMGAARYADYMRFLSDLQDDYISEMTAHLRKLGVKCLINCSNHSKGAAELRCMTKTDVTENNNYWNHPEKKPSRFHKYEMVACDPRLYPAKHHWAANMIMRLCSATVCGKPFVVTEFNNCYGTDFKAETMLMMAAYASLQDWDGMLFHAYSHTGNMTEMQAEFLTGPFDLYNDPSVFGMAGVASAIFQLKLVRPAENSVDIVHSIQDVLLPHQNWALHFGTIPFISKLRCKFSDNGAYDGFADIAVSAGSTPSMDLTGAAHSIVYARSPYSDTAQKTHEIDIYLDKHIKPDAVDLIVDLNDTGKTNIGKISSSCAVITDTSVFDRDSLNYSRIYDKCAKAFGVLTADRGLQNLDSLVSDTGELCFDHKNALFTIGTPFVKSICGYISGVRAVAGMKTEIKNKKAAVTLLSKDRQPICRSGHLVLTALGSMTNSNRVWKGEILIDNGSGPLLIDQIEGSVEFESIFSRCEAYALAPEGSRLMQAPVSKTPDGFRLTLVSPEGSAAMAYEIILNE